MKSSTLVLALATACGPGFTSGTYEGEPDGGTMVGAPDALETDVPETSSQADVSPASFDAALERPEASLVDGAETDTSSSVAGDGGLDASVPVVCNGLTCPPCGLYACCSPEGNCGCFYSGCWD
jgi:hypothetical protein